MNETKQNITADGGKTIVVHWIKREKYYQAMHTANKFLFLHFSGQQETVQQANFGRFKALAKLHGYAVEVYGKDD